MSSFQWLYNGSDYALPKSAGSAIRKEWAQENEGDRYEAAEATKRPKRYQDFKAGRFTDDDYEEAFRSAAANHAVSAGQFLNAPKYMTPDAIAAAVKRVKKDGVFNVPKRPRSDHSSIDGLYDEHLQIKGAHGVFSSENPPLISILPEEVQHVRALRTMAPYLTSLHVDPVYAVSLSPDASDDLVRRYYGKDPSAIDLNDPDTARDIQTINAAYDDYASKVAAYQMDGYTNTLLQQGKLHKFLEVYNKMPPLPFLPAEAVRFAPNLVNQVQDTDDEREQQGLMVNIGLQILMAKHRMGTVQPALEEWVARHQNLMIHGNQEGETLTYSQAVTEQEIQDLEYMTQHSPVLKELLPDPASFARNNPVLARELISFKNSSREEQRAIMRKVKMLVAPRSDNAPTKEQVDALMVQQPVEPFTAGIKHNYEGDDEGFVNKVPVPTPDDDTFRATLPSLPEEPAVPVDVAVSTKGKNKRKKENQDDDDDEQDMNSKRKPEADLANLPPDTVAEVKKGNYLKGQTLATTDLTPHAHLPPTPNLIPLQNNMMGTEHHEPEVGMDYENTWYSPYYPSKEEQEASEKRWEEFNKKKFTKPFKEYTYPEKDEMDIGEDEEPHNMQWTNAKAKPPVPPRPAPRPPVPGVSDALRERSDFWKNKAEELENNRTWDAQNLEDAKEARAADMQLILDADKEKLATQRKEREERWAAEAEAKKPKPPPRPTAPPTLSTEHKLRMMNGEKVTADMLYERKAKPLSTANESDSIWRYTDEDLKADTEAITAAVEGAKTLASGIKSVWNWWKGFSFRNDKGEAKKSVVAKVASPKSATPVLDLSKGDPNGRETKMESRGFDGMPRTTTVRYKPDLTKIQEIPLSDRFGAYIRDQQAGLPSRTDDRRNPQMYATDSKSQLPQSQYNQEAHQAHLDLSDDDVLMKHLQGIASGSGKFTEIEGLGHLMKLPPPGYGAEPEGTDEEPPETRLKDLQTVLEMPFEELSPTVPPPSDWTLQNYKGKTEQEKLLLFYTFFDWLKVVKTVMYLRPTAYEYQTMVGTLVTLMNRYLLQIIANSIQDFADMEKRYQLNDTDKRVVTRLQIVRKVLQSKPLNYKRSVTYGELSKRLMLYPKNDRILLLDVLLKGLIKDADENPAPPK